MTEDYFKNIWELYGVKSNPFSTSPLLVKGGSLPPDCFVGRNEQIKILSKIIASKGGSRSLVYGDVGVGKTTFVNFVRYKAVSKGFFTPFKEIAVQEDWKPGDFILNTLSAIYATLKIVEDNKRPVSKELFKKLETLLAVSTTDYNIGLSIAGFGGNIGRYKKPMYKLTNYGLNELFEEIVNEIKEKKRKEVIIHYNNIELVPENRVKEAFNNLRDFFQTNGVHFIFIGNLTTHSIIQSLPRVSSIFSETPIRLENLNIGEVQEIIIRRFEKLKIEDLNYFIPYTDNCLKSLYSLMEGNIRYILNSLSTAVYEATQEKPIVLDEEDTAKILKKVLEKRYLSKLTPRTKEVLLEIVNHKEITNKRLSDKLKIPRSNISQYLKDLQNKGCICLRRKDRKDKFWSAEHRIKWILLEKK